MEKTKINKKVKSCREVPLEIKMETGNNQRISCSTTTFENIRKIIIETVASKDKKQKDKKQRHSMERCNRNHQN